MAMLSSTVMDPSHFQPKDDTLATTTMSTTDNTMSCNAKLEKENHIRECLSNGSCSLWQLREMALTRGGFINAELRQQIWPCLVGLDNDEPWMETTAKLFEPSTEPVTEDEDRERDLIRRDVGRSVLFHHSCPSPNSVMGPSGDDAMSVKSNAEHTTSILASVLTATISAPLDSDDDDSNDKPHYYQGLHDIGGVLLHNLDYYEVFTTAILRRLCQTHLRDCARETFADLQWFLNSCLLTAVSLVDPPVHEALELSGVPLLSTVLPWVLTWFTHSVHDEEEASRLVDAFMASHPLLPFYLSIALLVHPKLRNDIVTAELDDPSSLFFAIQNLPSRIKSDWSLDNSGYYVTAQEIIETALSIMHKIPPKALLELVDNRERAEGMVLLKALTSVSRSSAVLESCSRAKMASGVSVHMEMQQPGIIESWLKPFGPPPSPVLLPPSPKAKGGKLPQKLRVIRNRLRSLKQRLPKSREGWIFLAYFSFIFVYAMCDFLHYTWVLFSTMLSIRAH